MARKRKTRPAPVQAVAPVHPTSWPVPYTQARPKLTSPPVTPPPQVYAQFASNLASLSTQQKQQLMAWLYQTNIAVKTILRLTVNPILGNTGFGVAYAENTPTIKKIVERYRTFNRFHLLDEQRAQLRQYVTSGELLLLTAPFQDTWYTVRCPSCLIRQTLLDPLNFQEIIAVILEPDVFGGDALIYKTIIDETRLSEPAKAIRQAIPYSCFFFGNMEHDTIEDAYEAQFNRELMPLINTLATQYHFTTWDWVRKQRRGEPFFYAWSDLFTILADVLWAMLDKTKSWGAFNYKFQINTNETEFENSVRKVNLWRQAIGTPEMNSAIYVDHNVDVQPMAFPMQSMDIKKILDIMLQVTGMSGNVTPYELGANLNSTYATTKSQGSPQEQFQIMLQTDGEGMYITQFHHILAEAEAQGQIPANELKAARESV